jgi:ADP-heptose:LPS heptosyltransferase
LRIGVSWRGGTPSTERATRSLALTDFAPLLDLPGCEVVSLQYGDAADEVAAVNGGLKAPVRIFPVAEIDDFEELSGLISNLDMVVSVQTSVVHLTGALGKEALVMVPYNPIWRYGATGPSMPWYGSVRLFRQPRPQAWEPVIAEVVETVSTRLGR